MKNYHKPLSQELLKLSDDAQPTTILPALRDTL